MTHNNQTGSSFDEKTGIWTHTFSQSVLGDLQKCGEMARAKYFKEVDHSHTDSTAMGTAVHSAIEYALQAKIDGEEIRRDDCIEVAMLELESCRPWKKTRLTEERILALIPTMFDAWLRDVEPLVEPMLLEWSFKFELHSDAERTINLSGTADCADAQGFVWDWKTASRPYEEWERLRFAPQPTVYTWALGEVGGSSPTEDFRYAVMMYDGKTQMFKCPRNETHFGWLKKQCTQLATMIESGMNPWILGDAGWWCGPLWCPKFQACKGAFIKEKWTQAA